MTKIDLNSKLKNNWQVAVSPTDTVWGLIAKPSEANYQKIYEIKGRDESKPLILFARSIEDIKKYSKGWSAKAQELAQKHFPGALTILLKRGENLPQWLNSEFEFMGFRVPDSKEVQLLFENSDEDYLLSTSANVSGEPPVANFNEAQKQFASQVDLIIEPQEELGSAPPSTIVKIDGDNLEIIRQGSIKI